MYRPQCHDCSACIPVRVPVTVLRRAAVNNVLGKKPRHQGYTD
ncbi:MAG: hypothetical protein R3E08_10475 [Thiotrichaceae bacterium]